MRQNPTGCGTFRPAQLDRDLAERELERRGWSPAAIALMVALQVLGVQTARGQNLPSPIELVQNNAIQPVATPQHLLQVTDEFGDALMGATVQFRAADSTYLGGTATDAEGYAVISSPEVAKVEISYIGYEQTSMSVVRGEGTQQILLLTSVTTLEEALVKAYKIDVWGCGDLGGTYGITESSRERKPKEVETASEASLVFPNPCRGDLHVRTARDGATPRLTNVYNLSGALVYSQMANESAPLQYVRLPPTLAASTYILEQTYEDGTTDASQFVLAR